MFSSCTDYLDREPLSSVTPDAYFTTTDHFAAYSISQYKSLFSTHGGYGMGIGAGDVLSGEAGVDDGPHIGPVAGEFLRHEQDDDRTQVVTVE